MRFRDCRFLADSNIHTGIVAHLRALGIDVATTAELGLGAAGDGRILREAARGNRVVLTHDGDFGALAIVSGEGIVGIVFLRPGHVDPQFTIESIDAAMRDAPELTPPFLMVVHRVSHGITIRVRSLG